MQINWGLAGNSGGFENALARGFQMGQVARKQQQEEQTKNALATVLTAGRGSQQLPGSQGLVATPEQRAASEEAERILARNNPEFYAKWRKEQEARESTAMQADVRRRAAQGDKSAMLQLAGIDVNEYLALDRAQLDRVNQGWETIGQVALAADTPEKWDATVAQLAQADPSFQKYMGQFGMRESVIAKAGLMKDWLDTQRVRWQGAPQSPDLLAFDSMGRPIQEGDPRLGAAPMQQAPQAPQVQILPQTARPQGKTDAQLVQEARAAIEAGANVDSVFRQLQAWGVNP